MSTNTTKQNGTTSNTNTTTTSNTTTTTSNTTTTTTTTTSNTSPSTTSTSTSSSKSITYSSTRGSSSQSHQSFRNVVMTGLAHDRGLFVPDEIPMVTLEELEHWQKCTFAELAVNVISKYVKDDEVPKEALVDIVQRSYGDQSDFRHVDVTPVVEVGGHSILELFHGPTFAFKDVALQLLGNFFEYFLSTGSNSGRLSVLGATSGDTGSAAIYGLRGKKGIDCIILYPDGRVSPIQERQMTTVPDDNIHCVAVEGGTFDDCQDMVKASFGDVKFRDDVKLGAVNSINWCRVLAQMTYYFWSYLRITEKKGEKEDTKVSFSVPTGNFGDVLAGYYAKRMGCPIDKLIVATNENDILYRFFSKGEYHMYDIHKTISPSMDICKSSNFERYLFHLSGNDASVLKEWMETFEQTGKLTLDGKRLADAQHDFMSAKSDTQMTLDIIKKYKEDFGYLLCPHSAVGVSALHQLSRTKQTNMIRRNVVALATAHEAKFPDACAMAVGKDALPDPPKELKELWDLKVRKTKCPNDLKVVQDFMVKAIEERRNRVEGGGGGGTSSLEEEKEEEDKVEEDDDDDMGNVIRNVLIVGVVVGVVAIGMQFLMSNHRR